MKVIALGVLAVALLIIAMYAAMLAQTHAREQAAVSVRESVLNAAKQCCAVEGSYPSTITHLEKEYGLVIMKTILVDGEEMLSTPDADEERDEVYSLFMERFFEDEEE